MNTQIKASLALLEKNPESKMRPKAVNNLREYITELEAALANIEKDCDDAMGDWSSVEYTYLPPDMDAFWQLREIARDLLGGVS